MFKAHMKGLELSQLTGRALTRQGKTMCVDFGCLANIQDVGHAMQIGEHNWDTFVGEHHTFTVESSD